MFETRGHRLIEVRSSHDANTVLVRSNYAHRKSFAFTKTLTTKRSTKRRKTSAPYSAVTLWVAYMLKSNTNTALCVHCKKSAIPEGIPTCPQAFCSGSHTAALDFLFVFSPLPATALVSTADRAGCLESLVYVCGRVAGNFADALRCASLLCAICDRVELRVCLVAPAALQ